MTTQIITQNTTPQNASGSIYSGTECTWIQAGFPTTNRNGTGDMRVDYDAGAPNFNGLLRFVIPAPPAGEVLQSARIYLRQVNNSGNNETIACYATLRPWVESEATWQDAETSGPTAWTAAGAQSGGNDRVATETDSVAMTAAQSDAYYSWDVTDDIGTYNAWVFEITTSDGNGGKNWGADDAADGQRPELVLIYGATIEHYAVVVPDGNYDALDDATKIARIKAGQLANLSAAPWSGSDLNAVDLEEVTQTASGLTSNAAYELYYVLEDDSANQALAAAVAFTTGPGLSLGAAAADATTGPTGNTASLDATTNVGNGTLYWNIRAANTVPSIADLQAGTGAVSFGSQAVSATGNQNIDNVGSLDEDTTYYAFFQHRNAAGADSNVLGPITLVIPADAPTLSAASGASTGATTADVQVNTNRTNGTVYMVVTQSVTQPSVAQIMAGQNHLGAAADYAASDATPTVTTSFSATGLTGDTGFYAHFYQVDAQGDGSNRVTSNSFTTGTSRAIVSFTPTVPRPGETVTVALSGGWNATAKTANLNGHSITLTSQNASQVQFVMPSLHTNPTFSDSRYGADLPFTLSDAGQDIIRLLNANPPAGYDYLTVASISATGIWDNDTDVAVGDYHLGYYQAGSGDPVTNAGDLQNVQAPATYRYWIFDVSLGAWSESADELLYETVTNDGSAISPAIEYEGQASAGIDTTVGFNAAEANITGYTIQAGTLPGGLSLGAGDGQITGTVSVSQAGSYAGIVVRATDGDGNTADSAAFTITVHAAPSWVSAPAPVLGDGLVAAYDLKQHLDATFADATSFSLAAGSLPSGVTLNTSTGVLEGTVGQTESGSSPFAGIQIQATNAAGSATSAAFSITVNPAAPSFIGTITVPNLTQNAAITPIDVSAQFGGGVPSSYQLLGTWPTGLSINSSGVISGTPTNTGTFTGLRVRALNASGQADSNIIASFTVSSNVVAPSWTAIAAVNVAENAAGQRLDLASELAGGTGPITFSIASGALPSGWSLNGTTGIVTSPGDRNNEGVYGVVFRATGPGGSADSASVSITITSSDPTVGTPIADRNEPISTAVNLDVRSNFAGTISGWSATGLPPGVSFSGGVFVGALSTPGSYSVTVTATNNYGSVQDVFAWDVTAATQLPVQIQTLPDFTSLKQGDAVNIDLADYFAFETGILADALPTGLSLVGTVISGTVTTVETVLTTLTVSNADGNIQPTINWDVATGAPQLNQAIPNLTNINGLPMSRDMNAFFTNGGAITLTQGALPTGLSITDGVVTGTPTLDETQTLIRLTSTNAYGSVQSADFSWTIRAAVASKGVVLSMGLGL